VVCRVNQYNRAMIRVCPRLLPIAAAIGIDLASPLAAAETTVRPTPAGDLKSLDWICTTVFLAIRRRPGRNQA
jgi:hypothetical protein